jgi:hypothetical protein
MSWEHFQRVHAELQAQDERVSKQRVARLMAQMGSQTKGRRRFKVTTQRNERHCRAPNVLAGDFKAKRPVQSSQVEFRERFEGHLIDVVGRILRGAPRPLVSNCQKLVLSLLLEHSDNRIKHAIYVAICFGGGAFAVA